MRRVVDVSGEVVEALDNGCCVLDAMGAQEYGFGSCYCMLYFCTGVVAVKWQDQDYVRLVNTYTG